MPRRTVTRVDAKWVRLSLDVERFDPGAFMDAGLRRRARSVGVGRYCAAATASVMFSTSVDERVASPWPLTDSMRVTSDGNPSAFFVA